jgi:N-methylhydantoinase B
LVDLNPRDKVQINLPGGGGYGDPLGREPEKVLWDVTEGYVSPEAAERDYGVVVRYTGHPEDWVKLPDKWLVDREKTAELRSRG